MIVSTAAALICAWQRVPSETPAQALGKAKAFTLYEVSIPFTAPIREKKALQSTRVRALSEREGANLRKLMATMADEVEVKNRASFRPTWLLEGSRGERKVQIWIYGRNSLISLSWSSEVGFGKVYGSHTSAEWGGLQKLLRK